jgi:hypothetical protein
VMPAAVGRRTPHLVVGERDCAELTVLSLPGRHRVHVHALGGGARVRALVADPHGTAIIVIDSWLRAELVVPWPLPGMPGAD